MGHREGLEPPSPQRALSNALLRTLAFALETCLGLVYTKYQDTPQEPSLRSIFGSTSVPGE